MYFAGVDIAKKEHDLCVPPSELLFLSQYRHSSVHVLSHRLRVPAKTLAFCLDALLFAQDVRLAAIARTAASLDGGRVRRDHARDCRMDVALVRYLEQIPIAIDWTSQREKGSLDHAGYTHQLLCKSGDDSGLTYLHTEGPSTMEKSVPYACSSAQYSGG